MSKEKENSGPVVRLKENVFPWLASAWQNSMHLVAKGDRSSLAAAAVISEASSELKGLEGDQLI